MTDSSPRTRVPSLPQIDGRTSPKQTSIIRDPWSVVLGRLDTPLFHLLRPPFLPSPRTTDSRNLSPSGVEDTLPVEPSTHIGNSPGDPTLHSPNRGDLRCNRRAGDKDVGQRSGRSLWDRGGPSTGGQGPGRDRTETSRRRPVDPGSEPRTDRQTEDGRVGITADGWGPTDDGRAADGWATSYGLDGRTSDDLLGWGRTGS